MKKLFGILILSVITFCTSFGFSACDFGATPPHTHEYQTKKDADKHWLECSCGDKKDEIEHVYTDGVCVCGQEETANPTNPENPYAQYSTLLQNLLNNEYYTYLLQDFYSEKLSSFSGYFKPHPYAFLQEEGFDTTAIKQGSVYCKTISFIKKKEPNNVYMATTVEDSSSTYTQYLLKYELTDIEVRDYKMLYDMPANNEGAHYARQTAFINDQISKEKTPTIISESYISKQTYNNLYAEIKHSQYWKTLPNDSSNNSFDFILNNFDTQTNSIYVYVHTYSDYTPYPSRTKSGVGLLEVRVPILQTIANGNCLNYESTTFILTSSQNNEMLANCDETIAFECKIGARFYTADLTDSDFKFTNPLTIE